MGLGRTFDISIIGRPFGVADLRNHTPKERPIIIIYNNYSNIIRIEIIGILVTYTFQSFSSWISG